MMQGKCKACNVVYVWGWARSVAAIGGRVRRYGSFSVVYVDIHGNRAQHLERPQ